MNLLIEAKGVGVCYGLDDLAALVHVSVTVRAGELVALVGSNGSGKSTLGRLLCGAQLASAGSVSVNGCDPAVSETDRCRVRAAVGMVCQDPSDQIVATRVMDEVAFGPRNLGLPEDEVRERVREALERTGLSGFEERDTTALSGGEQQRVAIAGMLAMRPRYLVLDETTAQLDAAARPAFRELFCRLVHQDGLGVVQITHDPVEILTSDRVVVLDGGHVAWEGTPSGLLQDKSASAGVLPTEDAYVRALRALVETGKMDGGIPSPTELIQRLAGAQGSIGHRVMDALRPCASSDRPDRQHEVDAALKPLLTVRGLSFAYGTSSILRDVNLDVRAGSILLLAGRSGIGKSMLAQLVAGLLQPDAGAVRLNGRQVHVGDVACAFQCPEYQFFCDTVFDELAFAPRTTGMSEPAMREHVDHAAELLGIDRALFDRYPFELSGGQARRVALASALCTPSDLCILDEPTAGLDAEGRISIRSLVRSLADEGRAVIVISHDLDEWLGSVDEVAMLGEGRVLWRGAPAACAAAPEVFARCGLAAPFITRLTAEWEGHDVPAPALRDAVHRPEASHTVALPLARVDARVKIMALLALACCVFLCHTLVAIAVWLLLAGLLLHVAGLGPRRALRSLRPVCLVLAFALCANLVSCDGGADLALVGPVGIDASAGVRGLVAVLRIVILVAGSVAVAETTEPTEVSDAVVRLLRPLARLGLPVGALGTVLSIALRFIPLVGDELQRIRSAQRVRGVRFDDGPLHRRIAAWSAVLTPLIVGLFRRADRLAAAMAARCYAGAGAVQVPRRPLAAHDRWVLFAVTVICACTLALALRGLI